MMHSWIFLVVGAQLLNAIAAVIDKHLVTRKLSRPTVYAFFVCLLSSVVLLILPFHRINWPDWQTVVYSLLTAFAYIESIIFLFKGLRDARDASDVIPVVGATTAIFTAIFSYFFFNEVLPHNFFVGSVLLILGTLLISHFSFNKKIFLHIFIAGILLGLSSVLVKHVFLRNSFIDGFFWSRIANVFAAGVIFLIPQNRALILLDLKYSSGKTRGLVLLSKVFVGIAGVLGLYAISLSSASLVNALSGLQYVFLLTFAFFFGSWFKDYIYSPRHSYEIIHKVIAVLLIMTGFSLFFI